MAKPINGRQAYWQWEYRDRKHRYKQHCKKLYGGYRKDSHPQYIRYCKKMAHKAARMDRSYLDE